MVKIIPFNLKRELLNKNNPKNNKK